MSVLLQIKNASKSYGQQVLLSGAEATLIENQKVGFIGRNGAGKSTLLRIILGEEELDAGEIVKHPRLRIGYLRQHDPFLPGETAIQFLIRDSSQPDWKCGEIAGLFEIKGSYLEGPLSELSGGWQTRVKLAALLLHQPNLLLLDEPTNFLDLRTQILLEHFIRDFNQACLVVSHDRTFLQATCDQTLDLSRGKLTMFPGKVDAFLVHQAERLEHDRRVNATVLAKKRQLEEFIAKNRARASTATQARSKSKQLEKLELVEIEADAPSAVIRAPNVEPRKGAVLRCDGLAIGYPERTIATEIQLEIEHGARAAIVGDNGQGKTTFLRTIVDSLPAKEGSYRWGYGTSLGTYAQHVYSSLPSKQTVLEYLEYQAARETKTQEILDVAAALLFRGEHVKKKISVLSGGERARLCMAGILLSDYNVLVLDEPGNHLDVETVEALADALLKYKGTVIFTSHDRHFMSRIASCIIEVRDGRVIDYRGNYESYLYSVNSEIEQGERQRDQSRRPSPPPNSAGQSMALKQKGGKEERQIRKEMSNLERTIQKLDDQRRALNEALMNATQPADALRLHEELAAVSKELESIEERWLQLQSELDEGA